MVFNPITTRLTVLPYPPLPCVPRWPLVEQVSCNAFVRPISLPDKKGCVPSTASIMTVQVLDSSASLFFLALAWDGVGCLCNWTTSFSLRLFSYPSVGIDFFGVQFDHFSFVHFFGFFDSQSDGPTKVLHQHFCLLHFAGVHFASHQGCKGNLQHFASDPPLLIVQVTFGVSSVASCSYRVASVRSTVSCITLVPSSWAIPRAKAVFPVPGAPASSSALPAIFFCRMRSTTSPHASLAACCPTNPLPKDVAVPSSCTFRPIPGRASRCFPRTMHARVASTLRSKQGLTV
mmetsp:Transcript_4930/g.31568  ORF Transcript_4930/g.31568 Transcript_4930/m.31568 type:complete len:289 (-) Transcript_4930:273-1139(-)